MFSKAVIHRTVRIVLRGIASIPLLCSLAKAEGNLVPRTIEPERFAFVVGNGQKYNSKADQRYGSNLQPLNDTCDEALKFRETLLKIGFLEDHIFPKISDPEANEEKTDTIRRSICELDNRTLSADLTIFLKLVGGDGLNLGVVFYAGHGAESKQGLFAFGVDAQIDIDEEIRKLTKKPRYQVFSENSNPNSADPTAINMMELARNFDGQDNNALLVIMDACRNDPILEELVSRSNESKAPIGFMRSDYFNANDTKGFSTNTMFLLSTLSGNTAVSADTGQKQNWFAEALTAKLAIEKNQRQLLSAVVSHFVSDTRKTRPNNKQWGRVADHFGEFNGSNDFCLRGCPIDANEIPAGSDIQTIETTPPLQNGFNLQKGNHSAIEAEVAVMGLAEHGLFSTATTTSQDVYQPLELIQYSPQPENPTEANAIDMDVFYCSGDALQDSRKKAALDFAAATRNKYPGSLNIGGTFLNRVRLRSFDINDNLAQKSSQMKTINTLVIPRKSVGASKWSDELSAHFTKSYKDNVTPYIRAYFCEGVSKDQPPRPTVYTQVAHGSDLPTASDYLIKLSGKLPLIRFVEQIEAVDDTHPGVSHSPNANEVRYPFPAQKQNADLIAATLQELIGEPVISKPIKAGKGSNPNKPMLEIWFGRNTLAKWSGGSIQ